MPIWEDEQQNFQKTVKLFISNKTNRNESDIKLIERNNVVKDRKNVADILNEYFINIAEYAVGRQIATLPSKDTQMSILEIKNRHENHINIQNIKNRKLNSTFAFEKTTFSNIRRLIFELDARKPMGIDTIPTKIIKMLNDDICNNIESIANSMVAQSLFPDQAKV